MVSKLKVRPFHRVNSPLEAPVTRRRPSGVHWRKQMDSSNIQNTHTHPSHPPPYPDHKHGTLDFVGGGSDKLCGYSIHRIVQHPQRRNKLEGAERTFSISDGLRRLAEAKLTPPHTHIIVTSCVRLDGPEVSVISLPQTVLRTHRNKHFGSALLVPGEDR